MFEWPIILPIVLAALAVSAVRIEIVRARSRRQTFEELFGAIREVAAVRDDIEMVSAIEVGVARLSEAKVELLILGEPVA